MCDPISVKRMLYCLWHILGMIKKLFIEPLLFFYLHPINYIAMFSFIAPVHRAEYHV